MKEERGGKMKCPSRPIILALVVTPTSPKLTRARASTFSTQTLVTSRPDCYQPTRSKARDLG